MKSMDKTERTRRWKAAVAQIEKSLSGKGLQYIPDFHVCPDCSKDPKLSERNKYVARFFCTHQNYGAIAIVVKGFPDIAWFVREKTTLETWELNYGLVAFSKFTGSDTAPFN